MKRNSLVLTAAVSALLGAAAGAWATTRFMRQPERVAAAFHTLFHKRAVTTFNNTYWRGVSVQKSPLDMWIYQEILNETRPDVLVEAGTYKGGSSYYFASLFDMIGKGRIITVDIEAQPNLPVHPRITYLAGSSTSATILDKIRSLIRPGESVMVSLDSDHHKPHVLKELQLYSGLVSKGQYLVVEDTHFNGHPILPNFGPGPMEAVEEFLVSAPAFSSDRSREKFMMSFNTAGYLRRR